MHLLFFAHKAEAQSFLNKGNLKKIRLGVKSFYLGKNFVLYLTGSPPILPPTELINQYNIKSVINLGTAARVNGKLKTDHIYEATQFSLHDFTQSEVSLGGTLLTQDTPYQQDQNRVCDFIDQEAYYLKQWCKNHKLPFYSYKLISDSGEEDLSFIREQAKKYSDQLYEFYQNTKMP